MRFGLEPQRKFTEEEKELDAHKMSWYFFMLNEMVSIKDAAEILKIDHDTIKQAAQQERLLNTKK